MKKVHQEGPELTTLPMVDFDAFYSWMLTRRKIDPKTARSYVNYAKKQAYPLSPEAFLRSYNSWLFKAFRLYIHFAYQMGMLVLEDRMRWLELLKLQQPGGMRSYDVPEDGVVALLSADLFPSYRRILEVSYYSGGRLVEAARLLSREIPFQDFGTFRRYEVGWSRGKKRCECLYLPSFVALDPKVEVDTEKLRGAVHKRNLMPPKMLRKFFYRVAKATALENQADPLVADYYQSRVSKMGVGEKHYGELRVEADRLYPKIAEKLSAIISP